MKNKEKNILNGIKIAAAGVSVALVLSHSVSEKLVEIALNREKPKLTGSGKKKMKGAGEKAEYVEAIIRGKEKLENSEYEDIDIKSYDGLKLTGHWKPCENPERIIVAMHGWRSSWAWDFGMLSGFWHDNQCSVLYAEQRGQGNSEGGYMGFGLLERYDCLEWIHWVNKKTGGDLPIYLAGISMGAATVLMTAGFELPENVRGIIADCGFTSPSAIWEHVVKNNLHLPYRLHKTAIENFCRTKYQMDAQEYSCLEAMETCKIPVLFIHGTNDKFVPVEMTYENYNACNAPKRILIVPEAGHGMSYFLNREEYERAMKGFWNDYDEKEDSTGEKYGDVCKKAIIL